MIGPDWPPYGVKDEIIHLDKTITVQPTANPSSLSSLVLDGTAGDISLASNLSFTTSFPDGAVQQYVGTQGPYILSSGAGTPRYRANWANTMTWGPFETTATIYYTSGLFMSAPDIQAGCFSTGPTGENFHANCRASSFTDVDLTGSYHINDHIELSAAVENLFDRSPPFDPIDYAGLNYNPTYAQAGIVGRLFKIGVHFKF